MISPANKTSWALFLDRDGVINERIEKDYVRKIEQFRFVPGATEALAKLKYIFSPIIIVTNQQGIGKGLMSESDLDYIHRFMLDEIQKKDGCIDRIYYCPALESENHPDRKPAAGMAYKAKLDFPEIDFSKSVMAGDSENDMLFGKNLGMKTVLITGRHQPDEEVLKLADYHFISLFHFSEWVIENLPLFR